MFTSARLDKVFRDIWDNKKRSMLVIATLAIGIAAVGTIHNAVRMMQRDMFDRYGLRDPAHLTIFLTPFSESLARDVEGMREVRVAEAQRALSLFAYDKSGTRQKLNLLSVPDFLDRQVNRTQLDSGTAQPSLRGVLIERNSADRLMLAVGDPLQVEIEGGERYGLTVEGIVHDMTIQPYSITEEIQAYVALSTLEWMGQGAYYNQIQLIVDHPDPSRQQVLDVGALARDRIIEPGGTQVVSMLVRGDTRPSEFWAKKQVDGVLFILKVMSILAIVLSAGLVVNTISAVLVQQTRQIGIMRSLGATRRQIILQYMSYVVFLSLIGLAAALPIGMAGAAALTMVAADFLNFNITALDLPPSILLLQIGLGLALPIGAGLIPVLHGAGISVYQAIYQGGLSAGDHRPGWLVSRLVRIRNLAPPVMLSLRNTFRNKSRLAFTLATLTVAGATFMGSFSSYTTLQRQVEELGRYIAFDAALGIPLGAGKAAAEREALRIPGVSVAEGWAGANIVIVHPDGQESDRIEIVGVPPNTKTLQPRLVAGRWLDPLQYDEVIVNEDLVSKEPSIRIGEPIRVKIDGQERSLIVVGIASKHMTGSRMYMDYDKLTRLTGLRNQVHMVRVLAQPGSFSSPAEQMVIAEQLEKRFEDAQLAQGSSRTRGELFAAMSNAFNILLIVLLLIATILAIIGGLGLTGAMGINVMERTREIGVLRAVGASHRSVRQVVVVEGATVALVSWILAAALSYPVGRLLAGTVIRITFGTQATFQYSYLGLLTWLAVVILIGVVASLAPARDAVRLTVREVLNYE